MIGSIWIISPFFSSLFQDVTVTTMQQAVILMKQYTGWRTVLVVVYVIIASTIPSVVTVNNASRSSSCIQIATSGIQTSVFVSFTFISSYVWSLLRGCDAWTMSVHKKELIEIALLIQGGLRESP